MSCLPQTEKIFSSGSIDYNSLENLTWRTGAFIWGNLAPTQIRNSFQTRLMVTQRKLQWIYVSLLELAEFKITLEVLKC